MKLPFRADYGKQIKVGCELVTEEEFRRARLHLEFLEQRTILRGNHR